MSNGLIAYGTYVPYWRLRRGAITEALGAGSGRGTRAVASYDEDTTSMGVEAARVALRSAPGVEPSVLFATTAPAYLDKTNATAIHAALDLSSTRGAYDMVGSVRSAAMAMSTAASSREPYVVVLSDIRTGLPGGADESAGGDGAAALVFGEGDPLVETIGGGTATGEFLDRWRAPGDVASQQWEERFGEFAYLPLAEQAFADACKSAGITPGDIDVLICTGMATRAVKRFAGASGVANVAADLTDVIGNTGIAHAPLLLADVLDRAEPGQVLAVMTLSDGVDVWLARVTDAITSYRRTTTVQEQIARGNDTLPYASFLTWRGQLQREPPRRPDNDRPAAPPSFRNDAWKYGFIASTCEACRTRHLPPQRVCVRCGAVDQVGSERLADVPGTIATYTIDRLAFSLIPPVVGAVVDFDGGGRFQCELTDVDPDSVKIGDRVEMTFRRLFTVQGVHNYFWKARPMGEQS
ncbi:MAG: hydroxymethylglutaryl-CoA synthase [Actinomycetota bacterium]